jgi:hypothetical protein
MTPESKRPLSLRCCEAIILIAARLVPVAQREDWKREWSAEIWHRWQFLLHAGAWNRREARLLIFTCLGAFPDAAWHLTSETALQDRVRERLRSPWTCLAGLALLLLALAILTSGFPATRSLFGLRDGSISGRLLFIWVHPSAGGGDQGVPSDLPRAWGQRSELLESVAGFNIGHRIVSPREGKTAKLMVITTERNLFQTLGVRPSLGSVPHEAGIILTDATWLSLFHRNRSAIGSSIRIAGESYRVAAVLPANFRFLTREPAIYLAEPLIPALPSTRLMVVARVKPGVSVDRLDRELTKIAESAMDYFLKSDLRYASLKATIWTPVFVFGIATTLSAFFVMAISKVRVRRVRSAFQSKNRKASLRRAAFFAGKAGLSLAFIFLAGLEWTRSQSAVLFASWDPANGPLLVWLYILGSMGVWLWALADQRARCRVCLRLLCFPVRVGCPGCLLLDWSGTELLCTEGHGVLHVPHLAPSWDEESDRWIALDDSWQELFAHSR